MRASIFKTGESSSFSKTSKRMYKVLSIGAGTLAIVYCLFLNYYFTVDSGIRNFSILFPLLYLGSFLLSFTKTANKKLYDIIYLVFIITSIFLIYIAYYLSFNSDYIVLMLAIFSVMLIALPTLKQLVIYFPIVFVLLETALFISGSSLGFTLLISLSFGAVFLLSYVIAQQKKALNFMGNQNAKILKSLVNNTKNAIFLIDFYSNEIQDANENTVEIFGLEDVDELLLKNYNQLFTKENFIETKRKSLENKISEDGYFQTDAMFKRKDGSNFLGQLHLSTFNALEKKYYLLQIKNIALRKM